MGEDESILTISPEKVREDRTRDRPNFRLRCKLRSTTALRVPLRQAAPPFEPDFAEIGHDLVSPMLE